MNKYHLIDTNEDPSRILREISIEEFETIIKNQNIIAHFKYATRRIKEVKGNFNELKNYHFDAQEIILKKPKDIYETLEDIFVNYNRLLINFCTSLKFLSDYLERELNKCIGENTLCKFKKWIHAIYESSFSYRLFYNLRNFVQHSEYPIKDFRVDRERYINTSIIRIQELSIVFDKEYLLSDIDLRRKFEGLKGFGEYFPVQPYILEIEKIIDLFLPKLIELEKEFIKESCSQLDIITNGKNGLSYGYFDKNKSYKIENDFIDNLE